MHPLQLHGVRRCARDRNAVCDAWLDGRAGQAQEAAGGGRQHRAKRAGLHDFCGDGHAAWVAAL
jgi:hypothetical protein